MYAGALCRSRTVVTPYRSNNGSDQSVTWTCASMSPGMSVHAGTVYLVARPEPAPVLAGFDRRDSPAAHD